LLEAHAKLVSIFKSAGEVVGRKKLQKIVYIAKKLNFPFQEKYQFHFYGPYSEELTLRIEELCNFGFIKEMKEKKGGYFQYRYELTTEGERFLEMYDHLKMPHLSSYINLMNDQPSRTLELISTILYFDELKREEVKEKVFTLKEKQNYTEEEIEEAFTFIANLRTETLEPIQ
jgi:uncharacterized protein YwgA